MLTWTCVYCILKISSSEKEEELYESSSRTSHILDAFGLFFSSRFAAGFAPSLIHWIFDISSRAGSGILLKTFLIASLPKFSSKIDPKTERKRMNWASSLFILEFGISMVYAV